MTKETWREKWLRAINELTSMELQRNCKIILTKNGSYWTIVDFVNFQFGEFLFGMDYLYFMHEKNWLYPIEYDIIKDWHNEIEMYLMPESEDYSFLSVQDYGKWLIIRNEGNLVKAKLKLVLPESEQQFLT